MDNNSFATRPGRIPLSEVRLERMIPMFFVLKPWMFWQKKRYEEHELFKIHVKEHLWYGLAETAVVTQLNPLLIACYTEELDCVCVIGYPLEVKPHPKYGDFYPQGYAAELIQRHNLQLGSRLMTVNTFDPMRSEGYEVDLLPGPKARGVYRNFCPYIAEFLTLDMEAVWRTKNQIPEYEWARCEELALEYPNYFVNQHFAGRDGRVHMSCHGHTQDWKPGVRNF